MITSRSGAGEDDDKLTSHAVRTAILGNLDWIPSGDLYGCRTGRRNIAAPRRAASAQPQGASNMMKLRSSPASPFGRKIKIAAAMLGLSDRIDVVSADTLDPNEALRQQNPLGKIPTLLLDDDRALYGSPVILEYLDMLAGGGKIIPAGPERFAVLTRQARAEGLADAVLLQVYEKRWREPAGHSAKWLDHQAGKVSRALAVLEANPAAVTTHGVDGIALACALGYLDLRFEGAWRPDHPKLVAWLDAYAAVVPAFEATRFHG
jgi:glutathione S-transferase